MIFIKSIKKKHFIMRKAWLADINRTRQYFIVPEKKYKITDIYSGASSIKILCGKLWGT